MIIEVVPSKNWSAFLEYFSRLHKELTCSIEILDGASEVNAGEHLKFSEISFTDGREKDLNIIAAAGGKEINHMIKNIKQICITRTNDEENSSILIQSSEDFITSLSFGKKL